jgi:hypothetical protein
VGFEDNNERKCKAINTSHQGYSDLFKGTSLDLHRVYGRSDSILLSRPRNCSLAYPRAQGTFLDTKESNVVRFVDWNGVTDTCAAVTNKFCGVRVAGAVDGLRVSALGCVACSFRGGEAQNVRPLLKRLLV